jgi:hypothetical protein
MRTARRLALPLVLCITSVIALGLLAQRGWIVTDEGVLAHSAQRVLGGELPHRDFDDVYTGGLALFDAGVFRLFGERLIALRIPLVIAYGLWTLAVYAIARRFATASGAALVTLLAAVWTVPCYPAAMPSWYTLFLFTAGTAALATYIEDRRPRWLVLAGLAGGAAITIKVIGLYYVAAVLLLCVFLERQDEQTAANAGTGMPARGVYAGIVTVLLAMFVAALVRLVHQFADVFGPLLHFVAPSAALVGLLVAWEWTGSVTRPWMARLGRLTAMVAPFLLGVALPIAIFLVPYIVTHALHALIYGMFVEPTKRFRFAAVAPPGLNMIGWGIPWVVLLGVTVERWRRYATIILGVIGLALVAVLIPIVAYGGDGYRSLWSILEQLDWAVVVVGVALVGDALRSGSRATPARLAQVWLLLCMSALTCLVRFPYAGSYYILYFAPVAMLACVAILSTRPSGAGRLPALVGAFLLIVGVTVPAARRFNVRGARLTSLADFELLNGPKGGLYVPRADLLAFHSAIALIQQHTPPNGYTYAGPDAPLIYFLADRRDPRRALYDFFDDPAAHDSAVLQSIDAHDVSAVAINTAETFSPPMDSTLRLALRARFPDSTYIEPFIVRWRDPTQVVSARRGHGRNRHPAGHS